VLIRDILSLPILEDIARMKLVPPEDIEKTGKELEAKLVEQFRSIASGVRRAA